VAAGGKVTIHWSRWFEDHRGPVSFGSRSGWWWFQDHVAIEVVRIQSER
jgi:hypothetical protein